MLIQGYILDIDGTLIESNEMHLESWRYALHEFGITKTDKQILALFARPTQLIARGLIGTNDYEYAELLAQTKSDYFISHLEEVNSFPLVFETMQQINELGFPICFASSNYNRVIESIIHHYQWDLITSEYIGMDDVSFGKPDPEMLLKAATKMGLDPRDCVMIGDSLLDIQAGKSAQTKTIGVCTGGNTYETFGTEHPDLILDQFADLNQYLPLDF